MALSNAERQRRYRQRLKTRAAAGTTFLEELTGILTESRTGERERLLPILRQRASDLSPEIAARWAQVEQALEQPDISGDTEEWKQRARDQGRREEEQFLTELLHDCISMANKTAKHAQHKDESGPDTMSHEPDSTDERDAQLKMADRFEKILQNRD